MGERLRLQSDWQPVEMKTKIGEISISQLMAKSSATRLTFREFPGGGRRV